MGLMNKFSQGKQMMKMVQQAKALEAELKNELIEESKAGIKVVVTGNLRIKGVWINEVEQPLLVEVLNEALKKAQKKAAKKAMALGNMFGL